MLGLTLAARGLGTNPVKRCHPVRPGPLLILSLRSFGRKARSCEPEVPILVWQLVDPMTCKCYLASWSQDLLILFNS